MQALQTLFLDAFQQLDLALEHAQVSVSSRPDLCDYQCNGALACAKQAKRSPRELAQAIVAQVQSKLSEPAMLDESIQSDQYRFEIAGPGFINITLDNSLLAQLAERQRQDPRSLCQPSHQRKTIVLDFGGPNVAKEMHVGHLRCAIIGESLTRVARFLGHTTISDVHLGDWGLPYGKTILELQLSQPELVYFDATNHPTTKVFWPKQAPVTLSELNQLYRAGSQRCKDDADALEQARAITAELQQGHPGYTALWRHFVALSRAAIERNYQRLDVHFDLWLGESDAYAYVPKLEELLRTKNLLELSQGAQVIQVAEPSDGDNPLPPLIYYKSNGAVTYGTTDLATILQRREDYQPHQLVYVVDQRQSLHFKQVFRAATIAGLFDPLTPGGESLSAVHVGYGTINDSHGKPLKSRDGEQFYLNDMLDQVRVAAASLLPSPDDPACQRDGIDQRDLDQLAEAVAMAAIKFHDLKNNTASDYTFALEQCTRFEGKTGPYLQYAVARINSIVAKAGQSISPAAIQIHHPAERGLLFSLLQTSEQIHKVFAHFEPSFLCDHAYTLAQHFSRFYSECPILSAEPTVQASRLSIALLTKQVLELELKLLGITTPKRIYTRKSVSLESS